MIMNREMHNTVLAFRDIPMTEPEHFGCRHISVLANNTNTTLYVKLEIHTPKM